MAEHQRREASIQQAAAAYQAVQQHHEAAAQFAAMQAAATAPVLAWVPAYVAMSIGMPVLPPAAFPGPGVVVPQQAPLPYTYWPAAAAAASAQPDGGNVTGADPSLASSASLCSTARQLAGSGGAVDAPLWVAWLCGTALNASATAQWPDWAPPQDASFFPTNDAGGTDAAKDAPCPPGSGRPAFERGKRVDGCARAAPPSFIELRQQHAARTTQPPYSGAPLDLGAAAARFASAGSPW